MAMNNRPIGVMDSGIGGLTVVRELQRLLPGEDIIYFGDSANCPYGNRTTEQITQLSKNMLQFLGDQGAKTTAIACNTISTLVDRLIPCFDYRIIGIVSPAADAIARDGLREVGLIATEFTARSGAYEKLIHAHDPSIEVFAQGSPLLAGLVDRGDFNEEEINAEITTQVDKILARRRVSHIILGCTHYPIVEENFKKCYPEKRGTFTVCTSGDPQVYLNVAKRLGLFEPDDAKVVEI